MYRTVLLLALMGLAIVSASILPDPSLDADWEAFKVKFNKIYPTSEQEQQRRLNFEKNYRLVKQHNKEFALGQHTYTIGIKSISDKSNAELEHRNEIGKPTCRNAVKPEPHPAGDCEWADSANKPLEASKDYRPSCAPVQDQGPECEGCWSFAADGAMECQYGIEKGISPPVLSEQELIDCIPENSGCCRGDAIYAYEYAMQTGVLSEVNYGPYVANTNPCQPKNPDGERLKIAHIIRVQTMNETQLLQLVNSHGVASSGIYLGDGGAAKLAHWTSGVYSDDSPTCLRGDKTSHAIVVVGFGAEDDGTLYWIIRNSWGVNHNDQGYFKLLRGQNMCGIARNPVSITYDPAFCPKSRPNYLCPHGKLPVNGQC